MPAVSQPDATNTLATVALYPFSLLISMLLIYCCIAGHTEDRTRTVLDLATEPHFWKLRRLIADSSAWRVGATWWANDLLREETKVLIRAQRLIPPWGGLFLYLCYDGRYSVPSSRPARAIIHTPPHLGGGDLRGSSVPVFHPTPYAISRPGTENTNARLFQ